MKNILEVKTSDYANFYSMNELLQAMTKNPKVWSWGARGWFNLSNKFLKFRVSGRLFRGSVYIGVNGKDLFDVYLTALNGDIKAIITDVYVEDLISTIDEKVEKVPEYKW